MNKSIIVICGATGTGKSSLGVSLAERLNTVIISADSRQIYREFDLGTAKPSRNDLERVPHFLIDICHPTESVTLAQYQEYVNQIIENTSHFPLLLVGGTGLYIKSITRGLKIPKVSPQLELRKQLQSLGQEQLYKFLQKLDPIAASKIHANDQVRTLRALEVYYVTGRTISEQQGESPPDYSILQIGLDCGAENLRQRLKYRTEEMISLGLVEEVKQLIDKYGQDLPLLETLGYAEIKQYLGGEISLESAIEEIILHTSQFAKRQRTWFRNDSTIQWYDAESPDLVEKVSEAIERFSFLQQLRTPITTV